MTQIEQKQAEIREVQQRIIDAEIYRQNIKETAALRIKQSKESSSLDEKILALHEAQLQLLMKLV